MPDPEAPSNERPRGPGRPRVLDDADVVDAAFRVIEEHGFAKLSMRAVARELGVPTMTIYGYVPNREALDALLLDRILSEVRIPEPELGTWDERLLILVCDARRTLVERPQLNARRAELGDRHPVEPARGEELGRDVEDLLTTRSHEWEVSGC